jgi:SagB-type dehydrogenase family enzyme
MIRWRQKSCPGILDVLRANSNLNRRQMCQMGAIIGLSLSGFLPFRTRHASSGEKETSKNKEMAMSLTLPVADGNFSLEKALKQRRTVRSFRHEPITSQQFSQIFWAAQGITEDNGFKRAAPSGGALYPADIYAVAGKNSIEGMTAGVYHYGVRDHSVERVAAGDRRKEVARASLRQMWMADAPVLFAVTLEYGRITIKYGKRGIRYALMEAGHIGQNIFLQCQTLGLAAGIVGAFNDREVASAIGVRGNHEPVVILPVGWKD